MRRLIVGSLALALSVTGFAPPAGAAKSPPAGQFVTVCGFSHRAPDDPIVFPGLDGASHDHDFFGNTSTDESSTYESLRGAGTTCRRQGDTAAYWVPSLRRDGETLRPTRLTVYYFGDRRAPRSVQSFPAGLRVIAGNGAASEPQGNRVTFWNCGAKAGVDPSSSPPACPDGHSLKLHIRFPSCWDGSSLDSGDHKSHLAYPGRGGCPDTHPVRVPRLKMIVSYPTGDPDGLALSSGGVYSGHADFFNAWDQATLDALVRSCLQAGRHCGGRGPGTKI